MNKVSKKELLPIAKEVLNKVEMDIFRLMFSQTGVVFLKGRPGTAKSAIFRSMCNKMDKALQSKGSGFKYYRLDLPTKDETDMGLYPYLESVTEKYKTVGQAVPKWAEATANSDYFWLIMFEEPNRAKREITNATLGIWNERVIGGEFNFQDNVFMAGAGNMGDEDGTDVEEFDTATKSRMKTVPWEMEGAEGYMNWVEMYAGENVHPDILRFLKEHPTLFHPKLKDQPNDSDVHINPRTWTQLSEDIIANYGKDSTIDDYSEFLIGKIGAQNIIGSYAVKLHKFLSDTKRLTINQLLSGQYKDLTLIPRENRQELAKEVEVLDIVKLKKGQIDHIRALMKSFKDTQDEDALFGLLYNLIHNSQDLHSHVHTDPKFMDALRKIRDGYEKELALVGKKAQEELDSKKV